MSPRAARGRPRRRTIKRWRTGLATLREEGLAAPHLSVNPSALPIIMPYDLTTLDILPGLRSSGARNSYRTRNPRRRRHLVAKFAHDARTGRSVSCDRARIRGRFRRRFGSADGQPCKRILRCRVFGRPPDNNFFQPVGHHEQHVNNVLQYRPRPRLGSGDCAPGQNAQATLAFATARGVYDIALEALVLPASPGSQNSLRDDNTAIDATGHTLGDDNRD